MHSSARTAFFLGYRHTTYCTKIRKGMISLSVLSLKASQALLIILGQLQRQAFTRKRPEVVVPWMVEFATACSLLVLAESRLWSLWSLESLRTCPLRTLEIYFTSLTQRKVLRNITWLARGTFCAATMDHWQQEKSSLVQVLCFYTNSKMVIFTHVNP